MQCSRNFKSDLGIGTGTTKPTSFIDPQLIDDYLHPCSAKGYLRWIDPQLLLPKAVCSPFSPVSVLLRVASCEVKTHSLLCSWSKHNPDRSLGCQLNLMRLVSILPTSLLTSYNVHTESSQRLRATDVRPSALQIVFGNDLSLTQNEDLRYPPPSAPELKVPTNTLSVTCMLVLLVVYVPSSFNGLLTDYQHALLLYMPSVLSHINRLLILCHCRWAFYSSTVMI